MRPVEGALPPHSWGRVLAGEPKSTYVRPGGPRDEQTPAQRELFAAFVLWGADERRWRPTTRKLYLNAVRRADRWLRERGTAVEEASPEQLRAYLWTTPDTAASRGLSSKALRAFGLFLAATGRRDVDPAAGLPAFPPRRGLPKALSAEQAARVLSAARRADVVTATFVYLLLFSGLRRTEAAQLRWSDVQGQWLTVDGKGGKERVLPLHPRAWAALQRIRQHNLSGTWVFPSPCNDDHMSAIRLGQRVKGLAEAAGLERLHCHLLRHTFATLLLEGSGDIRLVQEALGHASLATTQVYTAVRPERLHRAVVALQVPGAGAPATP